uniref:CW-type domain-containing protein n=1 Tax=Globodera pallida TaxID=36090 RepID=A0A183CU42_GLOPA
EQPKQRPLCPLHSSDHRGGTMAQEGSFSLKVQLPSEELRELQDFEEDCMDDLSRRKVRNTSDGFNEWEQWEDGGKAEDVASFRPNQLISCCCCGRTQQRWEKGEEPIPPMRIPLAGGGEERTNDGREAEEVRI